MPGSIRRLLGTATMAAVVSAGFVATAAAPAPAAAETVGYTVEFQVPNGVPNGIGGQRCRLATVDLASGAVTGIGAYVDDSLACAFDLAFSPGGGLYGISQVSEVEPGDADDAETQIDDPTLFVHLVRFDTATGAMTDLGQIGTDEASIQPGAGGVTFDASGNLWVYMVGFDDSCDGDAFCLYKVDPANPADATFYGRDPEATYLYGLTASCSLGVFTVAEASGSGSVDSAEDVYVLPGGDQLDRVNVGPPSAAVAVGALIGSNRTVQSLDFDSEGTLHALGTVTPKGLIEDYGQLSTLDPTTGVQTLGAKLSGVLGTAVFGLAVAPPTCPQVVEIQPTFTG